MNIQDILKDIMRNEGVSQVELARRMGFTKQAMSAMLKQKDMKVSTVVMLLYELGYCFEIKKIARD